MEPRTLIKQSIRKSYASPLEVAIRYYTLLSILNDLHITPREIQLLAFTAVRGSISSGGAKETFIQQFGSSKASIGNLVHSLSTKGLLVKEGKSVRVCKPLRISFAHPLLLNLVLNPSND
jgi:hypothetical protein